MFSPPTMSAKALCFGPFVCRVLLFVHPFIWTDLVTMISHEWFEQFDKTYMEYSLTPTNDLLRFWRFKVTAGIHIDTRASSPASGCTLLFFNVCVFLINFSQLLKIIRVDVVI